MKAVVLSLLCLNTFVTSAAAECAWVLWAQHPKHSETWFPETAYTAFASCTKRLDVLDGDYRKDKDKITTRLYPTKLMTASSTSEWAVTWQCLPDTVDPRGPKVK
jgi:hypothetical protein